MAITSETSRNDYVGTGLVTTYSYSFRIFAEAHLLVTQRDTDGLETALVLNTDYTVDGVGDAGGGSIELAVALEDDFALTIRRVLPLTQPTDISNQGSFFQKTHEDTFDRLTMMIQQLKDEVGRSLKASETDVAVDNLPTATERANKLLGFNASGQPIASSAGIDTALVTAFIETLLDDASAAEARATLGVSVADGTTIDDTGGILSVKDLGIGTAKIAALAVTDAKIASLATSKLTGTISESQIADNAVTANKIAADAVGSSEIAADAVGTSEISALAVTNAKINDVAASKITGTLSTSQIGDAQVTEAKLASAVVAKLGQTIGVVAMVSTSGNATLVNYSGSGRFLGVIMDTGLAFNVNVTITIDGVTIFSGAAGGTNSSGLRPAGFTNFSNGLLEVADTAAGGERGRLCAYGLFFRSSLVIVTSGNGGKGVRAAYERAA